MTEFRSDSPDVIKEKKYLIDLYLEYFKQKQEHIGRDEFCKTFNISRRRLENLFGTYRSFVREINSVVSKSKLESITKKYDENEPPSIPKEAIEYVRNNVPDITSNNTEPDQLSLSQAQRALLSEQSKKYDPNATKEDCIEDLRSLYKAAYPKDITRNYYREFGRYSDATWNQFFGTFLEFRRQAGLQLNRYQHGLEKSIAKQASVDHYRDYFRAEVMPFYRKYEKENTPNHIKTIKIASDIHDEECDEFALSVFISECERTQPDVIVLNGDIFDCYEFSRYTQDPRQMKLAERFKFVHDRVFRPLRKKCPNSQIDFIVGNHELRILKILADATPNIKVLLSDVVGLKFSDFFGIDEFQINFVSKLDLGVFSKVDIREQLKANYQVYYGCYAVCHEPDNRIMQSMSGTNGHHHSAQMSSGANLNFGTTTWVQTPCLHVKDAEYLKNLSGWNMGFLDVTINLKNNQVIQNIIQVHETWAKIDGVFYERKDV